VLLFGWMQLAAQAKDDKFVVAWGKNGRKQVLRLRLRMTI